MDETPYQFTVGQRVVVLAQPFYGVTGQLTRRPRLLGSRSWLVELDSPNAGRFAIRRTRVVETALAPAEQATAVAANKSARLSAWARLILPCLGPFAVIVWTFLPHLLAAVVDAGLGAAFLIAWSP